MDLQCHDSVIQTEPKTRSPTGRALFIVFTLLISPAFCISLLLLWILILPLWIASLIYLFGVPDELDIFTFPLLLQRIAEDIACAITGLDITIYPKDSYRSWPARTIQLEPRRNSFLSDFDDIPRQRKARKPGMLGVAVPESETAYEDSSRRVSSTETECTIESESTLRKGLEPLKGKPFDLTGLTFSPHWSAAAKAKQASPTPSPLDISLAAPETASPPLWPSPVTVERSETASPGSIAEHERFSPVRLGSDDSTWENIPLNLASKPRASTHITSFSTSLPDALRNCNSNLSVTNPDHSSTESSPSAVGDDATKYGPRIHNRDLSEAQKRALIAKYKALILQLEGSTESEGVQDLCVDEPICLAMTPLSMPQRPASPVPRKRPGDDIVSATSEYNIREDTLRWKENSAQGSTVVEGIKHISLKNHIEDEGNMKTHWADWDMAYPVTDKALDADDALDYTELWKQKWAGKGVKVLMPLDEESNESASSQALSPVSRKAVHWSDETLPTSPLAGVIPRTPESLAHSNDSRISLVTSFGDEQEYDTAPKKEADATLPKTPSPVRQRLHDEENDAIGHTHASRALPNSAPNSKTRAYVSTASHSPSLTPPVPLGKQRNLIRMFEELSKTPPGGRPAIMSPTSRSSASSPEHSVSLEPVPSTMLNSLKIQLDGSVDGPADEAPKAGVVSKD